MVSSNLARVPILALIWSLLVLSPGSPTVVASRNDDVYVVEPGDTLTAISSSTGVPADEIAALNDLTDPDALAVGQVLRLSDDAAAADSAGPSYDVQAGDTLYAIARRLNVPMSSLLDLNPAVSPDVLVPGQRIRVPDDVLSASSAYDGGATIATATPASRARPEAAPTATPMPMRPVLRGVVAPSPVIIPLPTASVECRYPPPWGTVIAAIDGVPVYSNGTNPSNGCLGTFGLTYQCVELVQRYFALRFGVQEAMWRGVGHAVDVWQHHPPGASTVPNGQSPGPQHGDVLVFDDGGAGHVALVSRVADHRVSFVEQNFSANGEAWLAIDAANVVEPRGQYRVLGWLHYQRPPNPS
ncbi:MAG TPA: LysM peptidoglycan-binding domain-containing protein [Chloroflexota bacterium]|nr:LysM peptidoglycan-binding domain-containing protein [Chloroflexota bacterium]